MRRSDYRNKWSQISVWFGLRSESLSPPKRESKLSMKRVWRSCQDCLHPRSGSKLRSDMLQQIHNVFFRIVKVSCLKCFYFTFFALHRGRHTCPKSNLGLETWDFSFKVREASLHASSLCTTCKLHGEQSLLISSSACTKGVDEYMSAGFMPYRRATVHLNLSLLSNDNRRMNHRHSDLA